MRPPLRETDKPLVAVTLVLTAVGLATLYSAGQTDVPSFVSTIWHRQLVWLGLGLVAALLMYRTSPRLLEWATPYASGVALVGLMFTLLVGTGGGTAPSARACLAIGGVRLGQPAEFAQLTAILMLA